MGLQHWPSPHDAFFQVLQILKGAIVLCPEELSLTAADHTRESAERKPGAEGHQLQHHRWSAGLSRSVTSTLTMERKFTDLV